MVKNDSGHNDSNEEEAGPLHDNPDEGENDTVKGKGIFSFKCDHCVLLHVLEDDPEYHEGQAAAGTEAHGPMKLWRDRCGLERLSPRNSLQQHVVRFGPEDAMRISQ